MIKKTLYTVVATILLPTSSYAVSIKNIEVIGNSRISTSTILAYVKFSPDTEYTSNLVDDSIKSLYGTGFFSDVKIKEHGGTAQIKIVENPLVSKIAFEGNKKISDKDLKKELSMTEYTVFSTGSMTSDVNRIKSLYEKKGRYNTKVNPSIIKLDDNRINVVYEVTEGTQSKIKTINFIGNHAYGDRELASVIASKESSIFRFFSSDDVYDENRVLYDQELLRQFYMNNGYADFSVHSVDTELSQKQDSFVLTFSMEEGEKYSYGTVDITSAIPDVKLDNLRSIIKIKPGQQYNLSELESTVEELTNYLGDHGYAFVDIEFNISKDSQKKSSNIQFTVSESSKLYINRIDIKNNTRTLDKVIRREFRISEGDPYNQSKLMRSKQRINNLGYFNSVNFKNTPSEYKDKLNVEVEVEEKSTGYINFGVGYDTSNGPIGMIKATESNFLGRGQEVGLGFSKAKRSTDIDFNFTEPRFMDLPLSAGIEVFRSTYDKNKNSNYEQKNIGTKLSLGYELNEHLYHSVYYTIKKEEISKVSDKASRFIKEEAGKHITSLVGQSFTYDKLDSRIAPTNGYILNLTQDFAGVGGTTKYIKHDISAKRYFPIYKKDVVLGLFASAGNIHSWSKKGIRLSDRYFIGSDRFRGFDISGIGPRDKGVDADSLGGTSYYLMTAELNFPLGLPKEMGIKGALFADAGSLFGSSTKGVDRNSIHYDTYMRASYGAGVIWTSSFTQIRLDYGVPFRKKKYDDVKHFRVQMGAGF